jgi:hypothetical protein
MNPRAQRGVQVAGSVIAVIVATALLVAGVTLFLNRIPAVELPEGFGGLPQASGPEIDEVLDQFHCQVEGLGIHGDIGLYGTDASRPSRSYGSRIRRSTRPTPRGTPSPRASIRACRPVPSTRRGGHPSSSAV